MRTQDTKYADLNTNLSAIGKAVFVKFYYDFQDASVSDDALANKIYALNPASKSPRQSFRISRARHIFQSGQQLDALRIIIQSDRVDPHAIENAKQILSQEISRNQHEQDTYDESRFISELNKEIIYISPDSTALPQYDNVPHPPKSSQTGTISRYKRDKTVADNALRIAQYLCEADRDHFVFRRKNCNTNYTEPHHLVPLSAGDDFPDVDLDREQNIISLCSNCHNLLHYGADAHDLLRTLYDARKELLASAGIVLSFEQLLKYY